MAITRDASQDCSSSSASATSQAATYLATATANKLLISAAGIDTDVAHVTPPSGWSIAATAEHNSGLFCVLIYYKIAAGTETAATWAVTSGATAMRVAAYQYSGAVTSSPLDKTAVNQSGATQSNSIVTGTTATTTQADELVFSAVHIDGAGTAITWLNGTVLRDDQLFSVAQRIVSATGTYSDTAGWTSNFHATAAIATFLAAAVSLGGNGWEVTT